MFEGFAAPVAEWLRPLKFSTLNRSSSHHCGFEPCSGHMWDKPSSAFRWSDEFSRGSLLLTPPFDWLGSLIFTGHKTQIKKKICLKDHKPHYKKMRWLKIYELPHDKTSKMACVPSEDSDQPGHPPSLIRVFAVRLKKGWILSYP